MPMLRFSCPTCQKKLKVDESDGRKPFRCPDCGASIAISNIIDDDPEIPDTIAP